MEKKWFGRAMVIVGVAMVLLSLLVGLHVLDRFPRFGWRETLGVVVGLAWVWLGLHWDA